MITVFALISMLHVLGRIRNRRVKSEQAEQSIEAPAGEFQGSSACLKGTFISYSWCCYNIVCTEKH